MSMRASGDTSSKAPKSRVDDVVSLTLAMVVGVGMGGEGLYLGLPRLITGLIIHYFAFF